MLSTVTVPAQAKPSQATSLHREELLFVWFHTAVERANPADTHGDIGLQHLTWEKVHFPMVENSALIQQVCICPHALYWGKGQMQHFLVNKISGQTLM